MRRYRAGAAAAFRQLYQPPGKHKQSTKDRLEKNSFAPKYPKRVLAGLAVCGSFCHSRVLTAPSVPNQVQSKHGRDFVIREDDPQ